MRVEDEAAFTLATIRAVVTQLKTDQKTMQEKLVVAERSAEENARKFELLAREIDLGLMIFDAQGYITFSESPVRKLLGVDTWSRRRYGEIFHDFLPCRSSSPSASKLERKPGRKPLSSKAGANVSTTLNFPCCRLATAAGRWKSSPACFEK